jgi:hypothetical protein
MTELLDETGGPRPTDAELSEALASIPSLRALEAEELANDYPRSDLALHEAAHAIIATVIGATFSYVTVVPAATSRGHIRYTHQQRLCFACMHAAGVAAYQVFRERRDAGALWQTIAGYDLELLRGAIGEPDATAESPRVVLALRQARALVQEFRGSVVLLALMLGRFGTLDSSQVEMVHRHAMEFHHG